MLLLLPLLFVGLVIRFLLIGNPGFVADIAFWKSWSVAAIDHGIVQTTHVTNINYPPGFIYVLWFIGTFYSFFSDPHNYFDFWRENNFAFLFAAKSVAIVSDICIALLLYWCAKNSTLSSSRTASPSSPFRTMLFPFLVSGAFYLNPVVILDSALWGQVESFGFLFTLCAILLIFSKRPVFGTILFTVGVLMKLQNIIYIPLYFLYIFLSLGWKKTVHSLAAFTATFFLVTLPFVLQKDMNQVLYLLTVNGDYFPWMSLNAHNLWWIVSGAHGMTTIDKVTTLGIANAKTVGLLLFSSLYAFSSLFLFLRPSRRNFLLSLTISIFSFFLFTTQSHERYSYPVLVLLLLFFVYRSSSSLHSFSVSKQSRADRSSDQVWWRTSSFYFFILYTVLTLSIFFNVHWGLVANYPQYGIDFLTRLSTPAATLANSFLLLLLFLLILPFVLTHVSFRILFVPIFLFFLGIFFVHAPYLFSRSISLTAFKPIVTRQDYATLQINRSVNSFAGWKKWNRLSVDYFFYRKGFGTHANSLLAFDIKGKFSRFETDVGIDTEADTPASVVFQIFGDGRKLYESERKGRFDFPSHAAVDVSGVSRLELVTQDGGDGINNDHADWLNPLLYE